MELGPIWRAMMRNKTAYVLIALQIAVTMAIMVNAFAIIQERSRLIDRPQHLDGAGLRFDARILVHHSGGHDRALADRAGGRVRAGTPRQSRAAGRRNARCLGGLAGDRLASRRLIQCVMTPFEHVQLDEDECNKPQKRIPKIDEVAFYTPVDGGHQEN